MEGKAPARKAKAPLAALILSAMALLCAAIALCAMSALRASFPERRDSADAELRIREKGGLWHWLVFAKYDCGIAAFDRYEASLHVNEYSALDRDSLSKLLFIVDGKAYSAGFLRSRPVPGLKEERAWELDFAVSPACAAALARVGELRVRSVARSGDFTDYSVPEPERFAQALSILLSAEPGSGK